jgi:hypothetical protein
VLRKTDLRLVSVVAPGQAGAGPEWTVLFRLDWADLRHVLEVAVPARDLDGAELAAWRAMADHLGGPKDWAARQADRGPLARAGAEERVRCRLNFRIA